MSKVISILLFLLIFCIIVVSHEFGHFIIAKANGIRVKEFFIGFGPKIIHWKKNETEYSIRLLPLGGACVFDGMDGAMGADDDEEDEKKKNKEKNIAKKAGAGGKDAEETSAGEADVIADSEISGDTEKSETSEKTATAENAASAENSANAEFAENSGNAAASENSETADDSDEGSFLKASVWSRFATIFAGPFFNIILGFIIAFIMVNLIVIRDPVATEVIEGGAAQEAGIEAGDRIVSMNGQKICLYEDIVLFNALYTGGDVKVVYERDGQKYETVVTPQYDSTEGRYLLGISNSTFVELKGWDYFKYTWYEMRYNIKMTYGSLWKLVRGKVKSTEISGPVGVANVVTETYESTIEYGIGTVFVNMLNIALMLTVNLGLMNLLPIPALDGGRLLFIIWEMITGKPVPPEKEAIVHFIGIIFFLVIIVLVFFNDIKNVFFK